MNRVTAFDITAHDAHALTARTNQKPTDRRVRSIIASLTGSCASMMTGFGIAMPVAALLAGLGSAFITTGLGVCYLDITDSQHRSVAVGIRESAVSFGAVAGPLLAAFISRWLAPQGIFTIAALTTLAAAILALVVLMPQSQARAHAFADTSVDAGRRVAATILTTRAMVEVAPAMRASAARLTAATDDVVCALHRVTSPLASQGGYNEEVGKAALERMAA